jgi:GNAT superfamily N-acetyltransferase
VKISDINEHCDISPETGCPLRPVKHFDTKRHIDGLEYELAQRQQDQTAAKEICKFQGRVIDSTGWSYEQPEYRWKPKRFNESPPLTQATSENPYAAKIDCQMRPATLDDMGAVAIIYHEELKTGVQVLDLDPLPKTDFDGLWRVCKKTGLPFIVVVRSQLGSPRVKYGRWLMPVPREVSENDEVIAFGFMSIYQLGITGAVVNITGRHSLKANVFVHPDHRGKRVGGALLDRLMLLSAGGTYSSTEGVKFVNPDNMTEYEQSSATKCHNVFAEVMFKPDDEEAKRWFDEWLVLGFNFDNRKTLERCHRARRGHDAIWLDKGIYQYHVNALQDPRD